MAQARFTKDLHIVLYLAEDLPKRNDIILVGGALYAYNGVFYSILHDDDVLKMLLTNYRREVARVSTVTVLKSAATLLRYCVKRVYEEFPVNSRLIVFQNGTLEVDTGRFRENSPADLATSALGINYNPNHKEMPCTKRFLKTIADGDDDLYELMLQVIGYILSNDIRAKSFFYLEGVGDAGKSRFCDLIASFFPVTGPNKQRETSQPKTESDG